MDSEKAKAVIYDMVLDVAKFTSIAIGKIDVVVKNVDPYIDLLWTVEITEEQCNSKKIGNSIHIKAEDFDLLRYAFRNDILLIFILNMRPDGAYCMQAMYLWYINQVNLTMAAFVKACNNYMDWWISPENPDNKIPLPTYKNVMKKFLRLLNDGTTEQIRKHYVDLQEKTNHKLN